MAKALMLYHSQQHGNTGKMAEAVAEGLKAGGCEVTLHNANEKRFPITDFPNYQCVAFGTPDYFSYMAGGLKDFFDRTYYPTEGEVTDKPCGIFVTHGGGGKAVDSVERVCRAFKFKLVGKPVLVENAPDAEAQQRLGALGKALAEAAR